MSEMVLVLPILMVILSLAFYLGHVGVRIQRASMAARYETWRQVDQSPGPRWDPWHDNHTGSDQQLNNLFFGGQAQSVDHWHNDNYFPPDTLDEVINLANGKSADAAMCAELLLFREPAGTFRLNRGHREGFRINHPTDVPLWDRIDGPIERRHARIGRDWRIVNDPDASADTWQSNTNRGNDSHLLRGVRDAFFTEFDEDMDDRDLDMNPEYSDYPDGPESPNHRHLAGMIRRIYLDEPHYRGPIVAGER